MKRIAAVIFHRSLGASYGERLVTDARRAAALDLIERIRTAGLDRIFVVTGADEGRALEDEGVSAVRISDGRAFHFGDRLKSLIREEGLDGILYFGSGSGPLFPEEGIERLLSFVEERERGGLFNNFYSCDFAAIAGTKDLPSLELPRFDNPLGFVLADGGFPCYTLERSSATDFDIDTPTDIIILKESGVGGKKTRAFLESIGLNHPSLADILPLLADRSARISIIGRVNPGTWARFERAVASRTSGIIDGRGMRSSPERSGYLLNRILRQDGIRTFFEDLAGSADGALIDTRPLLADRGNLPPAADRFASDLLRPEEIEDPIWREFTAAALDSPIPVILGGHSLVSGGLHLLAEACWKGRDLPRRLHPEPFDWKKEKV